jgi:mono/diheme cytochrome c family protein
MTRQRTSLAYVALLLMVIHRQQPHLAASPGAEPVNLAALPLHLADTGLFTPGSTDVVAAGNRPFSPQYPLWTDGATKRRWVYLPEGTSIDASDARRWEFPVGTRFWKEFSFAGRRVETRVLWKASPGGWLAGSYVWNQDGTDAVLTSDGMAGAIEIVPGRQHNVPSGADCAACHGTSRGPLGFNPLQLSNDRDPNAIHGEPLTREMITLQTLIDEQRLTRNAGSWRKVPPRIDTADPQTRTVLGYLSGNCGACHNGDGQISAQVPSFAYADLMDGADLIAERMIGQPTRWQAPGRTEGTMLIDPSSPDRSALLLRMRSRRPSSQMPPLGTVLHDQQAITSIGRWISEVVRETRD